MILNLIASLEMTMRLLLTLILIMAHSDFAGQDADFKNDFDLAQATNRIQFRHDDFDDEVGKDFAPPGKNEFSETGFGDDTVVVSPENVKGADDVDSFNQNDKATVQKDNDLPSVGDADFEVAGEAGFLMMRMLQQRTMRMNWAAQGWGSADGEVLMVLRTE